MSPKSAEVELILDISHSRDHNGIVMHTEARSPPMILQLPIIERFARIRYFAPTAWATAKARMVLAQPTPDGLIDRAANNKFGGEE
jgi:hypothetical protein